MLIKDRRYFEDWYVEAYNLGWKAKQNGKSEKQNKYSEKRNIGEWNAWLTGFRECTE